ncbi:MAG: XRE family transcriptional regulator [Sphingobacteriaceae bacterium]|nr:MAG: XRE family transcriptional regulator [Sphingobacteriaceae bacterium]
MKIHAKIKLLRHNRGYRQHEVAGLLDISIPAYSKIETGLTDVNLSRLEQLAALYQISLVQLIDPAFDPLKAGDAGLARELAEKLAERTRQVLELQNRMIELYRQLEAKGGKKTA